MEFEYRFSYLSDDNRWVSWHKSVGAPPWLTNLFREAEGASLTEVTLKYEDGSQIQYRRKIGEE